MPIGYSKTPIQKKYLHSCSFDKSYTDRHNSLYITLKLKILPPGCKKFNIPSKNLKIFRDFIQNFVISEKCVTMARICDWKGKMSKVEEQNNSNFSHSYMILRSKISFRRVDLQVSVAPEQDAYSDYHSTQFSQWYSFLLH